MSKINYYDLSLDGYEDSHIIRFFNISECSHEEFLRTVVEAIKVDAKNIVAKMVEERKTSGRHAIYPIYGTLSNLIESVFFEEMKKSGYHLCVEDPAIVTCHLDVIGNVFFTKRKSSPYNENIYESDDPLQGKIIKELRDHIGEVKFPEMKRRIK